MRKLITICLLFFCFSSQSIFAQLAIESPEDFGRIFDLTYDASVPNKVYAVTIGNHIVVSEDNGATWNVLYTLIVGESASIQYLKLTPDGTGLTFAVYTPNQPQSAVMIYDIASAEIVKTFPLPNQDVNAHVTSYAFYNGDTDVLVLDTSWGSGVPLGKTFYTTDGGLNWNEIYYTENHDKVFVNNVAISPNNPDRIFLARGNGSQGVEGGLFVSENAGQTWEEKLPGIILGPLAFDPSNVYTILLGTDISFGSTVENLYKSLDGGNTFETVPISWTDGILDAINVIRFNASNPSQIIILEENEIAISNDAGATWQNFVYPNDNPESYYYGINASFNPQNSEEIFISASYVPLFSTDGGETLSRAKTPYYSSTGNMDLYVNGDNANLYYGVQFGYVHRDLNSGIDTPYDIMPLNFVSNSPGITEYADKITPNRVYTFTSSFIGSSIKVSDDNGATKNELASISKDKFTAVATFPAASESILAAFTGFESSQTVLKRYNFSDINNVVETDINLPKLDVINGILIDAVGKIVLSIGVEIYSSIDGGATWINNSNGLATLSPDRDLIFDLERDSLNQDRLAIATSKGVFISNNGGENWEQKSTDLVYQVAFSTENERAIVASTYSSLVSQFALHYSTDNGDTWETIDNEQLLNIGGRSSAYLFNGNTVKVYIGTFDLGLMTYTIDLSPLGSPTYSEVEEIKVYPNPVKDILNIQLKDETISEIALYNVAGKQLLDTKGIDRLNLSSFDSGVYLVRVKTSTDKVFFKRIIVE